MAAPKLGKQISLGTEKVAFPFVSYSVRVWVMNFLFNETLYKLNQIKSKHGKRQVKTGLSGTSDTKVDQL